MLHEIALGREFLALLLKLDEAIAWAVASAGCRRCSGPLHRADYARKPRGARIIEGLESFAVRHSLCCARRGCRKRALPPSVRFLGQRVYVEPVVVLASMWAGTAPVGEASEASGVPKWTLRRWSGWWRRELPRLPAWLELRARFAPPPPDEQTLPGSLVRRLGDDLAGGDAPVPHEELVLLTARCLAPLTTRLPDGSRFMREIVERPSPS